MKGTNASNGQPHVLGAKRIRLENNNGFGNLTESWNPQPIPKMKGTDASNGPSHVLGVKRIRLKTSSGCENLTKS